MGHTQSEFSGALLAPYEVNTVLYELADRVTEVLGLAGCGIGLAHGSRLEFDTANGRGVAEIEQAQQKGQAGLA
jgi:hypothetical protein